MHDPIYIIPSQIGLNSILVPLLIHSMTSKTYRVNLKTIWLQEQNFLIPSNTAGKLKLMKLNKTTDWCLFYDVFRNIVGSIITFSFIELSRSLYLTIFSILNAAIRPWYVYLTKDYAMLPKWHSKLFYKFYQEMEFYIYSYMTKTTLCCNVRINKKGLFWLDINLTWLLEIRRDITWIQTYVICLEGVSCLITLGPLLLQFV